MAKHVAPPGHRPDTERRIHVLPTDLLDKVRGYQKQQKITSEVEAVRRLLTEALQARETIRDILMNMSVSLKSGFDLRSIAKNILSDHTLVKRIDISEMALAFVLRDGAAGEMNHEGHFQTGNEDDQGYIRLTPWDPYALKKNVVKAGSGGSDVKHSDLDDEIPF